MERSAVTAPPPKEDYAQAARRLLADADSLYGKERYMSAGHLFGLAAECAIKARLARQGREARVHLPELISKARMSLQGRVAPGLCQLMCAPGYMAGWKIDNRYWADQSISAEQCSVWRDQARRTLHAAQLGGVTP